MKVVEKLSPSFFAAVEQQRRRGPPLDDVPDLSSVVLPSAGFPPLLVFSEFLPLTFSALQVSPLFRLDTQAVPFAPALGVRPLPQHVFWPSWSCNARRQN